VDVNIEGTLNWRKENPNPNVEQRGSFYIYYKRMLQTEAYWIARNEEVMAKSFQAKTRGSDDYS
jgi:hypothetical protein